MSLEDRLPDALREAMAGAPVPTGLAAAGLARGRQLRRARRLRIVAGSTAVALLGVGGTIELHVRHERIEPASVLRPSPMPSTPSRWLTGKDLAARLLGLLPAGPKVWNGEVTFAPDSTVKAPDGLITEVTYRRKLVRLLISRTTAGTSPANCRPFVATPGAYCQVQYPDAGTLVVRNGYENPFDKSGETGVFAVLTRADGGEITLIVRGRPYTPGVLTPAQVAKVVTSPVWEPVIASIPGGR